MTMLYFVKKSAIAVASICAMAATLSVSCNKPTEAPQTPPSDIQVSVPALADLAGGWEADRRRWDISDGKGGLCYLMNEKGDDYARDDKGGYITITLLKYLENYAADYNADPANEIKGTPEDFADQPYSNSYMFSNFAIENDEIRVNHGQRIPDAGTMSVECVRGPFTYDPATGLMTINDISIAADPRTLKMKVWKETYTDSTTRMCYQYIDYDIFVNRSYDNKITYDTYASTVYYTEPGEPFKTETNSVAARSTRLEK